MKIQEYIESGNLEAYVIGELPSQQMQQIEKLMEKHPELRNEVIRIQETFNSLAVKAAIEPPASVKSKLFSKLESQQEENLVKEAKVIAFENSSKRTNAGESLIKYLVAASVTLAIVSSVAAVNFWHRFKKTDQELVMVLAQNERIEKEFNTVSIKLDKIYNDFEIVSDSRFTTVELAGTQLLPGSSATIFWMEESGEIYLKITNLPAPSITNHYHLWAIVDGKPVNAGKIDLDEAAYSLLKMKRIRGVSAFAITLEKETAEKTSIDKILVSGKI